MQHHPLRTRKTDILDDWKALCFKRRLAYENNNIEMVSALNQQLMQQRKEGGWSEKEVKEEFAMYNQILHQPFSTPMNNRNIHYDVVKEDGRAQGLALSLHQISQYWKYRDSGLQHSDALHKISQSTL